MPYSASRGTLHHHRDRSVQPIFRSSLMHQLHLLSRVPACLDFGPATDRWDKTQERTGWQLYPGSFISAPSATAASCLKPNRWGGRPSARRPDLQWVARQLETKGCPAHGPSSAPPPAPRNRFGNASRGEEQRGRPREDRALHPMKRGM